jgi:hypothetical protein
VSHGSPLMEELPELRRLAESHAAVQWADRIMKKRLIMCFRAEGSVHRRPAAAPLVFLSGAGGARFVPSDVGNGAQGLRWEVLA